MGDSGGSARGFSPGQASLSPAKGARWWTSRFVEGVLHLRPLTSSGRWVGMSESELHLSPLRQAQDVSSGVV